jgi:hypothetical protein
MHGFTLHDVITGMRGTAPKIPFNGYSDRNPTYAHWNTDGPPWSVGDLRAREMTDSGQGKQVNQLYYDDSYEE